MVYNPSPQDKTAPAPAPAPGASVDASVDAAAHVSFTAATDTIESQAFVGSRDNVAIETPVML